MIEWIKANAKPLAAVLALVLGYALAKWFPGLEKERELLVSIVEALGLLGVVAVPPFMRVKE